MAILYWHNQGRLGNLLFQYAFLLHNTDGSDRIYTVRNEVFDLIDVDRRFHLLSTGSRPSQYLGRRIDGLLRLATDRGLIGSMGPVRVPVLNDYMVESTCVESVPGIIKGVFRVAGFFQYGDIKTDRVIISPTLLEKARMKLAAFARGRQTVAVHVRLTDYGGWMVYGQRGAVIPSQWYKARMADLRQRIENPLFLIFSDDRDSARRILDCADAHHVDAQSALDDFTQMSLCDHAIVSPSSFAWWAVMLRQNPHKIIIAPTYWAGFKSRTWFPTTIKTAKVEYFETPRFDPGAISLPATIH